MKAIVIIILNFVLNFCSAQDSMVVTQQRAKMYSNKYVFFKDGRFKHYYRTDDLQEWYGEGTYADKGRKRILKFGDANLNYKIPFGLLHYEANFMRILLKTNNGFKSKDYYNTTRKRNVFFK